MWFNLLTHQRVIGSIYAAVGATLDVILAVMMCYSLHRRRTEILYSTWVFELSFECEANIYDSTNSIIDKLVSQVLVL
jgi:hypothetical protein